MNTTYSGDKNTPVSGLKVLTVYYDGGCPMCAREVGMYRSLKGAESIKWVNLSELHDFEIV
ncbi:MAG: DCC1-like thiol-disulfide oxidoreductase family protein, partial [Pseudomonadota bacterium]|nr:DCC1-like thiol-disulfide oxidoreductase family protein [Pseudomonadota bacterium]